MFKSFSPSKLLRTIALLSLINLLSSCAISAQSTSESFTGEISAQDLLSKYPKFFTEFQQYHPETSDLTGFKHLAGYDIVVFFGLWCHDSQREVPRLIKLIENSEVALNSLKMVAIGTNKQLPAAYNQLFEVEYTPTIFVLKDQQVLAKLVEKPKQSITKDLLNQILF